MECQPVRGSAAPERVDRDGRARLGASRQLGRWIRIAVKLSRLPNLRNSRNSACMVTTKGLCWMVVLVFRVTLAPFFNVVMASLLPKSSRPAYATAPFSLSPFSEFSALIENATISATGHSTLTGPSGVSISRSNSR